MSLDAQLEALGQRVDRLAKRCRQLVRLHAENETLEKRIDRFAELLKRRLPSGSPAEQAAGQLE
jgi:uncharacterized protein YigA (DUF484 family)